VPPENFSRAITWKSSAFQIACVGGPALGGFLIGTFGRAWEVFVTSAALYFVYSVTVFCMSPRPVMRAPEPVTLRTLAAGFRFVWNDKIILATITLDLFAVLFGGATALLPIYAKYILHVGAMELGWLVAAPAIGAFCMALAIAHLPPSRNVGRQLLWAVAGFGVATIIFGLSHWLWLSLLALFLTGALDNISVVVRHSLVQLRTPDAMRGRVSAVNNVFISSSNELGAFESGLVAKIFGPVFSVVSGGIGTILVVLLTARVWPEIARLKSMHDPRAPAPGSETPRP
jgi:MFS family permease